MMIDSLRFVPVQAERRRRASSHGVSALDECLSSCTSTFRIRPPVEHDAAVTVFVKFGVA